MTENPDNSNGKPQEEPTARPRTFTEEIEVAGRDLLKTVEKLVHEGNIRRLIVKDGERVILDVPLTLAAATGIVTMIWAPVLAMLGAVGGLAAMFLTKLTVIVERVEDGEAGSPKKKTKVDVEGDEK